MRVVYFMQISTFYGKVLNNLDSYTGGALCIGRIKDWLVFLRERDRSASPFYFNPGRVYTGQITRREI